MIHGIFANKATFHPVLFTAGLNVILAERHDASDQKETRNGLGKSTLIQIIDFCLGSSVTKGEGLGFEILNEWAFTIDITVAGKRVKATRAVSASTRLIIDGDTDGWMKQPTLDEDTGEYILSADDWKKVLGWSLFKLQTVETTEKYKPSFRSLVSYFVRLGPNAYTDPFSYFRNQNVGSIQLNIAYLIGLNAQYAATWQELKDKDKALNALEDAVDTGVHKSAGDLEAEKIRLEDVFDKERKELAGFKVHEQYSTLEIRVNQLTKVIHEHSNANLSDRRKLQLYKDAGTEEAAPDHQKLEDIYKQSGLLFPDTVKRSLNDAKTFHSQIIKNRKEFLEIEVTRLKRAITDRENEIKSLTIQRAALLEILETHGAFEEYMRLQEGHAATGQKLENVKSKIADIRNASSQKKLVKAERLELTRKAEIDYEERRNSWEKAVRFFNEHSQALYNTPGKLVIDISEKGYKFDVEIERSESEGIGKMKLFCFDLMLARLWSKEYNGIDFLVHDSVMYDGVDARQRALALELAASISLENDFQYICTLNSDMIPASDFSKDFDFESFVRLRLTDAEPSSSLLGIRY